jgi:hypothetical protein
MNVRTVLAAIASAGFAVLVACSSSSGDNGASSAPICKGNAGATGPGSSACTSCTNSKCGSQLAALESACGAYVACYQDCECSDLTCIGGCTSNVNSSCEPSVSSVTTCLSQSCASECAGPNSPDGG